jgi:hypothetical protein
MSEVTDWNLLVESDYDLMAVASAGSLFTSWHTTGVGVIM